MNKKVRIVLLSVLAFLILGITTTYGLWYVTRNQTNSNIIATKCLDISLTNEQNDITLTEAYPMTDEEGLKLTPYTFTVTNNCNTKIDYQLNLELLGDSGSSVSSSAIKVSLNDNTTLLSNKETRETTIKDAYESYQLMYGRLEANESEDYSLRLWVDENAPVSESNKVFESKISVIAGQGIENPFEEETLAHSIIGNAGGLGNITELSTKWQEGIWQEEQDINLGTTKYYWGTGYELDKDTGRYILSGEILQAKANECKVGTKDCGEYTLKSFVSAETTSSVLYKVTNFKNDKGTNYIKAKAQTANNNFSSVTSPEYAKLHKAEDDFGTSYYYRGAVQNNYVKFGKWSDNATEIRGYLGNSYSTYINIEDCNSATQYRYGCTEVVKDEAAQDMYWRIVRINGDGTIRMIYDGIDAVINGTSHNTIIGKTAYNTNNSDGKYIGYTYENDEGTQEDSTIKSILDNWYDINLESNYGTYVADSIFCNDRTSRTENETTYYGAYDRLFANKTPQLTCAQKEDKYTVSNAFGNGYLSNPVGLITADEVAMAGGLTYQTGEYGNCNWQPNKTFYLYSGYHYWSFNPSQFIVGIAYVWSIDPEGNIVAQCYGYPNADGTINHGDVSNELFGIRPVINLKADLKFIGDGTINNPYEIVMN